MPNSKQSTIIKRALIALRRRFSLIEDKADDAYIDASIRAGVELRGTNLWVLMFAILIASIGLNVNSTAVIIGAMLISPLMGPIMGVGYGVGIYDTQLIKTAFRNLAIATGISLFVSTLYFLLTPLADAQSELLARTTPTIWDVLIAFIGGLAGIIGATRHEKTNIIPGVAIATALMPPLCTAGYGLAHGNWAYFGGAFYLYSINAVFIALAAVLIIWLLNPAHRQFIDKAAEVRIRRILSIVVLVTLVPSIYLAAMLVKQEVFKNKALAFIEQTPLLQEVQLIQRDINPKERTIQLTIVGKPLSPVQLQNLQSQLQFSGPKEAKLLVKQTHEQSVDVTSLKSTIVNDLYKDNLLALAKKTEEIAALKQSLSAYQQQQALWSDITAELHAQYPQMREVLISQGSQWRLGTTENTQNVIVLNLKADRRLDDETLYRITEWLKVRAKNERVKVIAE